MNPNNIIKGKRPEFFSDHNVDYLMHMVMVLSQELNVVRDRLDTIERVAADKDLFSDIDIDQYTPDHEVLEEREERRQNMLNTLFSVVYQEAEEIERKDSLQRYKKTIDDIAS